MRKIVRPPDNSSSLFWSPSSHNNRRPVSNQRVIPRTIKQQVPIKQQIPMLPPVKPKIIPKDDIDIYADINCKILPPTSLNKKFSLFVSGSTFVDIEEILANISYQKYDLIVFKSLKTNCIYKDALITRKIYWDISEIIDKQIQDYKNDGYPKNNELLETDVIFRSKIETVNLMNDLWLKETQKYKGTPDVYGFNYAVFKSKIKYLIL